MLPDGRSARAAGCGAAFLDGGCGYDLGTAPTLPSLHTPHQNSRPMAVQTVSDPILTTD